MLGVSQVDDNSFALELGVKESLLRRAHVLQRHARLTSQVDPRLAREPRESVAHLLMVVSQHHYIFRIGRNPTGIIPHSDGIVTEFQRLAFSRAQNEMGIGNPVVDPASV